MSGDDPVTFHYIQRGKSWRAVMKCGGKEVLRSERKASRPDAISDLADRVHEWVRKRVEEVT